MRRTLAGLAALMALGLPAQADPMEDALYIVDHTTSGEMYEAAFEGLADLMIGNMQNEFARGGSGISKDAADVVVQMLVGHMTDRLIESMRAPLARAYVYNVSPEALAAYRAFLETPEGQEISLSTGVIARETVKIGEDIADSIAMPAVDAMMEDMRNGNWPQGTLPSTRRELEDLFLEEEE